MSAGMFDHFKEAKNRKAPPWAGPVLGAAVIFHIVLFVSMDIACSSAIARNRS